MIRFCLFIAAACVLAVASPAVVAEGSPDDVLVENAAAKVTRGDYEVDLTRVPVGMRDEFAASTKRLTAMLNNLLIAKTLAAEARRDGTDRDPDVARLIALETDKALAAMQLQRLDKAAGAEFDAKQAEMLTKAREEYAINKDKYRAPEEVKASHILFETRTHDPETALARAKEVRAKLVAGADFATLAKEVSEDRTAKQNGGELGWFRSSGQMDQEFAKAAFSLKNVGDLSEPVRTSFGYHVIRLEGRHPERQLSFDEVKGKIMGELRTKYIQEKRDAKIASIREDPKVKVNEEAVGSLVHHFDPSLFGQARPQPQ